jgi:hypothetical protein
VKVIHQDKALIGWEVKKVRTSTSKEASLVWCLQNLSQDKCNNRCLSKFLEERCLQLIKESCKGSLEERNLPEVAMKNKKSKKKIKKKKVFSMKKTIENK